MLLPKDDVDRPSGKPVRVKVKRDLKARSGDLAVAVEINGVYEALHINERGPKLLFGRLIVDQNICYVESEQPDYKGRVSIVASLETKPADAVAGAITDFPERLGGKDGDRVAVSITGEDRYGLQGNIVEVVAERDAVDRISAGLLKAYQIPTVWPEALAESLSLLPDAVDPESYRTVGGVSEDKTRIDLTALPLVTIDGADSRDFDDAVYCQSVSSGGWRLVVAIADVGHYVLPGSALDECAIERGNSVYLPDQVVPMLPEQLSNDLCSLRPEQYRLALVCDMHINANGTVGEFTFYEAIIRSWQRLTYSQVHTYLTQNELLSEPAVRSNLDALHECYLAQNLQSAERGALEFDTREVTLKLNDAGEVAELLRMERNDAHKLIETAMISANVCAARFLADKKVPTLYRVHSGPEGEKLDQLRALFRSAGVSASCLKSGTPTTKQLSGLLSDIQERPDAQVLAFAVLRSMGQAFYAPENTGHFGLSLEYYTHFTSPIRRYADLLVHRAIKNLLAKNKHAAVGVVVEAYSEQQLTEIGQQISVTERRAEDISRDVTDWYKCSYAEAFVGDKFLGQVTGVTDFGLFIELEGIWVQGLLHISNLGSDYFEYVPEQLALIGERSGRRFQLGQMLEVVLADVNVESRKVDLLLQGAKAKKSHNKVGKKRRDKKPASSKSGKSKNSKSKPNKSHKKSRKKSDKKKRKKDRE